MMDIKGKPKPVFYTDEKFTLGKVAHKELELPGSVPTHRAEFNLAQAPAGYGSLTGYQRVEFTLREGAEPIRVNKLVGPMTRLKLIWTSSLTIFQPN